MLEWWNALTGIEKIYWGSAIISSIFFVIMFITTFLGVDADHDGMPDDLDGEGAFHFFTFRGLVGFFTVFSWVGLACVKGDLALVWTLLVSIGCGLVMMFLMAYMFYAMSKMQQSGTLVPDNAIGSVGEVYLKIGASRSTMGKVSIKLQGALREMDALTDGDTDLQFGQVVKVTEVISGHILVVEPFSK
jgi:membrane protein implicated in regulation of membrane protease activity